MTTTTPPLTLGTDTSLPTAIVGPKAGARTFSWLHAGRSALNVFMVVVAVLWLLPSFSMLVISFRQAGLFQTSGWWNVFAHPLQWTLYNYRELFFGATGSTVPSGMKAGSALDSVRTSLEITVPATLLVVGVSALAAYSLVFGRWRGRNAVFLTIVGLMVVPLQVAI
ncbi:MAG TPA: hypothetical protein VK425_12865, partial [Acidimicrobiales bacterium]|nr:hypothetical protein [Acidimicrobiales bacterium]